MRVLELLRRLGEVFAAVRLIGELLDAGLGFFELLPHLVGLLPGRLELGRHALQALAVFGALRRPLVLVHLDHEGRLLVLGLRLDGPRFAVGRRPGVLDQRRQLILVMALDVTQLAQLLLDRREHAQDLIVARGRHLVLGRFVQRFLDGGRLFLGRLVLDHVSLGLQSLELPGFGLPGLGLLGLGLLNLGFLVGHGRGSAGLRLVVLLLEPVWKWHGGPLEHSDGAHGARGEGCSVVIDTSSQALKRWRGQFGNDDADPG
ncbi:MAG: hypothetical protein ACYSUA_11115 [Planctomycetota bacterium]